MLSSWWFFGVIVGVIVADGFWAVHPKKHEVNELFFPLKLIHREKRKRAWNVCVLSFHPFQVRLTCHMRPKITAQICGHGHCTTSQHDRAGPGQLGSTWHWTGQCWVYLVVRSIYFWMLLLPSVPFCLLVLCCSWTKKHSKKADSRHVKKTCLGNSLANTLELPCMFSSMHFMACCSVWDPKIWISVRTSDQTINAVLNSMSPSTGWVTGPRARSTTCGFLVVIFSFKSLHMTPLVSKKLDKATGCRKKQASGNHVLRLASFHPQGLHHDEAHSPKLSRHICQVKLKHPCFEGCREIHVATPNQYCCVENPDSEGRPHKFQKKSTLFWPPPLDVACALT